MEVITYPCRNQSLSVLAKWVPGETGKNFNSQKISSSPSRAWSWWRITHLTKILGESARNLCRNMIHACPHTCNSVVSNTREIWTHACWWNASWVILIKLLVLGDEQNISWALYGQCLVLKRAHESDSPWPDKYAGFSRILKQSDPRLLAKCDVFLASAN